MLTGFAAVANSVPRGATPGPPIRPADKTEPEPRAETEGARRPDSGQRLKWKKVSLANKLGGVSRTVDATVADIDIETRRGCKQKVKYLFTAAAWKSCCVSDPQVASDELKRCFRKTGKCALHFKQESHPRALAVRVQTTLVSLSRPLTKCGRVFYGYLIHPSRLLKHCACAKEYLGFCTSTIGAWLRGSRVGKCIRWTAAKIPVRPAEAPPRCYRCRSGCRRTYLCLCRGHVMSREVGVVVEFSPDQKGRSSPADVGKVQGKFLPGSPGNFLVYMEQAEVAMKKDQAKKETVEKAQAKQAKHAEKMRRLKQENLKRRKIEEEVALAEAAETIAPAPEEELTDDDDVGRAGPTK
jgi:hypothetical protein